MDKYEGVSWVFDFGGHRSTIAGQSRTIDLTGFFYFLIQITDLIDADDLLPFFDVIEDHDLVIP